MKRFLLCLFFLSCDIYAKPIVIAHRGASGYLPEHTLAAYSLAIFQGADYIEPDLVMTKDGHLIARHDNLLKLSTDVAKHQKFRDRKKKKTVSGYPMEGWFSEDFTLAEIKELRAVERTPKIRPSNTRFDGNFTIPSFEEILKLVRSLEKTTGRTIGIYPETKHPSYFQSLNLSMERPLVDNLKAFGYGKKKDPIYIQSFEVENLKKLRKMTKLKLVQLIWRNGQPHDQKISRKTLSYQEMATAKGLKEIAKYANGVGPEKYHFILPKDEKGRLDIKKATQFVSNAKKAGLEVHPYTFRAEAKYLPTNFQNRLEDEIKTFLKLGIDGFFIDQPDIGRRAVDSFTQ